MERAHLQPLEFPTQGGPAVAGLGLGHPDKKESQPAQEDMGPDALFFAVIDGTKIKHVLEIPPAPLHLAELFVAESDVLGRERGVA